MFICLRVDLNTLYYTTYFFMVDVGGVVVYKSITTVSNAFYSRFPCHIYYHLHHYYFNHKLMVVITLRQKWQITFSHGCINSVPDR